MRRRLLMRSVLPACLLAYASFIYRLISAANTRTDNELLSLSAGIPHGDKIGHFLVMGLLALMVNLLLNNRCQSFRKRNFLLGSLIVAGIVTAEEFTQIFIPSRTFSPLDLAADYAGIFVFGRLSVWLQQPRQILLFRLAKYRLRKAYHLASKRVGLTLANRLASAKPTKA